MPGGMPGGMGNAGGDAPPTNPDEMLKDGRYVDDKGVPLHATAAAPFAEYNLMAFKLTVVADEQHWDRLLIELCNSPLPLEVREVRLNPASKAASRAIAERRLATGGRKGAIQESCIM